MSRKHYERIAEIIAKISDDETREKVMEDMMEFLGEDNPLFARHIFRNYVEDSRVGVSGSG